MQQLIQVPDIPTVVIHHTRHLPWVLVLVVHDDTPMVPPPAPARELHGCSVAILRLGAFTARARGACRVDSRWGVGGIRAAKVHCRTSTAPSHTLRAPSCTSGTPSRTSQTSTLSYIARTLSYILRTSLMAPIHPLVHPVHALMSPSLSILVRAKAMLIRVVAHRSQLVSPLILVRARAMLIQVVAHRSQTRVPANLPVPPLLVPSTYVRVTSAFADVCWTYVLSTGGDTYGTRGSLAPANNGTLNSFVRRSGHAVKPTEKIRETLVASSTSAKRSAPEPPQGVPAPKRVFVSQEDDYDDNEDAPALEDVTE
ncbi:hypothetical protein EV424DRAFT_1560335 [Suillus variegatus]|nr:hypothetical protein EV424DRAFT_1560335 [Suillus variegatus]